jgi:hypothetical protein
MEECKQVVVFKGVPVWVRLGVYRKNVAGKCILWTSMLVAPRIPISPSEFFNTRRFDLI